MIKKFIFNFIFSCLCCSPSYLSNLVEEEKFSKVNVNSSVFSRLPLESSRGTGLVELGVLKKGKEGLLNWDQADNYEYAFQSLPSEPEIILDSEGKNPPEHERWHMDRRTLIENVLDYPYRCVLSLSIELSDKRLSVGSAGMISERFAITAAHNIFDPKYTNQYVRKITAYLGREQDKYHSMISIDACCLSENFPSDHKDYAILDLGEENIGQQTGWMSLKIIEEFLQTSQHNNYYVSGYPVTVAHKDIQQKKMNISYNCNGREQYQHNWENQKLVLEGNRINYDIDSTGGQSGSPLRAVLENNWYTLGVHIGGSKLKNLNIATAITLPVKEDLENFTQILLNAKSKKLDTKVAQKNDPIDNSDMDIFLYK